MRKDKSLRKIISKIKDEWLPCKKVVKEELMICKSFVATKLLFNRSFHWNHPWQHLKRLSKFGSWLYASCFGKNCEVQNEYAKELDGSITRIPLPNGRFCKVKLQNVKRAGDPQYYQGLLELAKLF
nr:hypothetical transcript [Hymenolepis microstoma]